MAGINQRVHDLFEEYRDVFADRPVSFDGVVDENEYLSSAIRTTFLLKEINGEETVEIDGKKVTRQMSSDWEYMNWMYEQATIMSQPLYKTWPNACLWIEVLFNPDATYQSCLNKYGYFDTERLRSNLRKISIVNIKKTPGAGSSVYSEIEAAAKDKRNVELLHKEISTVAPQLVICGGTFHFAKMIFNVMSDEIKTLSTGTEYFLRDGRVYLDFVHPMWFNVDRKILFAYAKEVFRDVKRII